MSTLSFSKRVTIIGLSQSIPPKLLGPNTTALGILLQTPEAARLGLTMHCLICCICFIVNPITGAEYRNFAIHIAWYA